MDDIRRGIDHLVQNEIIDTNLPFFDAGAGDGRVMAITSIIFNIPSFGLEYDADVLEDGMWKMHRLDEEGLINMGTPLTLRQGDFNINGHYARLGIEFQDIATFFNFDNNYRDIATMILQQSPLGTVFLLERIIERVEEFNGLKFVANMNLSELGQSRYNLSVYQKQEH